MPQERDLFANFERMRREMDELFGDVLDRGLAPRRRGGFSPAVDGVYQQLEIERGPFRRVVSLGAEVDADSADATYEDGILTVELPLSRPARPRTVPIRGTER